MALASVDGRKAARCKRYLCPLEGELALRTVDVDGEVPVYRCDRYHSTEKVRKFQTGAVRCLDVNGDSDEWVLEADYGISNMLLSEVFFTFIYFNASDNAVAVITNSKEDKMCLFVEYNWCADGKTSQGRKVAGFGVTQ